MNGRRYFVVLGGGSVYHTCTWKPIASELSGTQEGIWNLIQETSIAPALLSLIDDADDVETSKNALTALVNISAEEDGCKFLLCIEIIVPTLLKCIEKPENIHADLVCSVLVNLTHLPDYCVQVLEAMDRHQNQLEKLVFIFYQEDYNKAGATLDLVGAVIANISQTMPGRKLLLKQNRCILQYILPSITLSHSYTRRKAAISTIHNCCFEKDAHDWLLSDEIDVASHLALPLAGGEFLGEDNESLPIILQYLPNDKVREPNAELRAALLESLMQLCSTRKSREVLRKLNIYVILREHHKWEEDEKCLTLNEDVVNFLIRTEEEIGVDDLSALEIPFHLRSKFQDES